MSFGFSIGDFIALTQLAWTTVENARKACQSHSNLVREVRSLHIVLSRLELEVQKPDSLLNSPEDGRRRELLTLAGNCGRILEILDKVLVKYNLLSEDKATFEQWYRRVQFGNGEMLSLRAIRGEIGTYTQLITLFLNLLAAGSQGKVEAYMNSLGLDVQELKSNLNWVIAKTQAREARGEDSVLTRYQDDDVAVWKDFRRQLIRKGVSSRVLQKHQSTIEEYIKELGDRGVLDDPVDLLADPDVVISSSAGPVGNHDTTGEVGAAERSQKVNEAHIPSVKESSNEQISQGKTTVVKDADESTVKSRTFSAMNENPYNSSIAIAPCDPGGSYVSIAARNERLSDIRQNLVAQINNSEICQSKSIKASKINMRMNQSSKPADFPEQTEENGARANTRDVKDKARHRSLEIPSVVTEVDSGTKCGENETFKLRRSRKGKGTGGPSPSRTQVIDDPRWKFHAESLLPRPRIFEGKRKKYRHGGENGKGSNVPLNLRAFD